jgi:hypothetical protein
METEDKKRVEEEQMMRQEEEKMKQKKEQEEEQEEEETEDKEEEKTEEEDKEEDEETEEEENEQEAEKIRQENERGAEKSRKEKKRQEKEQDVEKRKEKKNEADNKKQGKKQEAEKRQEKKKEETDNRRKEVEQIKLDNKMKKGIQLAKPECSDNEKDSEKGKKTKQNHCKKAEQQGMKNQEEEQSESVQRLFRACSELPHNGDQRKKVENANKMDLAKPECSDNEKDSEMGKKTKQNHCKKAEQQGMKNQEEEQSESVQRLFRACSELPHNGDQRKKVENANKMDLQKKRDDKKVLTEEEEKQLAWREANKKTDLEIEKSNKEEEQLEDKGQIEKNKGTSRITGWFRSWYVSSGLKGGADQEKEAEPITASTSKSVNAAIKVLKQNIEDIEFYHDGVFVQGDGNCLFRAVKLASKDVEINYNPQRKIMFASNLIKWKEDAADLRVKTVCNLRNKLVSDPEMLANFKLYNLGVDIFEGLERMERDKQYNLQIADSFLQVLVSEIGSPVILVNMESKTVDYLYPETLFKGEQISDVPLVIMRSHDHFDVISVKTKDEQRLINVVKNEKVNRQKAEQRWVVATTTAAATTTTTRGPITTHPVPTSAATFQTRANTMPQGTFQPQMINQQKKRRRGLTEEELRKLFDDSDSEDIVEATPAAPQSSAAQSAVRQTRAPQSPAAQSVIPQIPAPQSTAPQLPAPQLPAPQSPRQALGIKPLISEQGSQPGTSHRVVSAFNYSGSSSDEEEEEEVQEVVQPAFRTPVKRKSKMGLQPRLEDSPIPTRRPTLVPHPHAQQVRFKTLYIFGISSYDFQVSTATETRPRVEPCPLSEQVRFNLSL